MDVKPLVVFVSDADQEQPVDKSRHSAAEIDAMLHKTALRHGWEQSLKRSEGRPERTLRQRVRGVLKADAQAARERLRKGPVIIDETIPYPQYLAGCEKRAA